MSNLVRLSPSVEFLAPETKLLEAIDIAALVRSEIRHVELSEQVSKLVFHFLLQLFSKFGGSRTYLSIINELELGSRSVLYGQSPDVVVRLDQGRGLLIHVQLAKLLLLVY